jgi:choline dehydrogenase-like flavoprotein
MGGATVAAALAPTGRRILILERGEHAWPTRPRRGTPRRSSPAGISAPRDMADARGGALQSRQLRLRRRQYEVLRRRPYALPGRGFRAAQHMGGESPGWPMTYDEIEPWYQKAEVLYRVRGQPRDEDPTEPRTFRAYPFPPVPDEPEIADLRRRLSSPGLHPASLPLGVDSRLAGARARRPGTPSPIPPAPRWMPKASGWPRR